MLYGVKVKKIIICCITDGIDIHRLFNIFMYHRLLIVLLTYRIYGYQHYKDNSQLREKLPYGIFRRQT
jgi:hypothetical protein